MPNIPFSLEHSHIIMIGDLTWTHRRRSRVGAEPAGHMSHVLGGVIFRLLRLGLRFGLEKGLGLGLA